MKEPKRYYCGNGEGMFEDDKSGHWVEYSEHKVIVEALTEQLRIADVSGRSEQSNCVHCHEHILTVKTLKYKCKHCGDEKWVQLD